MRLTLRTLAVLLGYPSAELLAHVADLRDAPSIEDDTFDCVLLTQTLPFIRETERVIAEAQERLGPVLGLVAPVLLVVGGTALLRARVVRERLDLLARFRAAVHQVADFSRIEG